MNWASAGLAACLAIAAARADAEAAPDVDAVLRELSDLDRNLSIEGLDRAHEIETRLDLLDQLETKLLDIAKKRQDRRLLDPSGTAAARPGDPLSKPLIELEADPRVVDIIGHGRDLTARLVAGDRSTFAVKVGASIGAYRIEAISAEHGVEVVDSRGRRHNLPEVEDSEASSTANPLPTLPPPGVVPIAQRR